MPKQTEIHCGDPAEILALALASAAGLTGDAVHSVYRLAVTEEDEGTRIVIDELTFGGPEGFMEALPADQLIVTHDEGVWPLNLDQAQTIAEALVRKYQGVASKRNEALIKSLRKAR
jgi:hypothetical protein